MIWLCGRSPTFGRRWPCFGRPEGLFKLLGCVQDVAETRAQLANARYTAARYWEDLVDSRKVCAQVSYQSVSCVSI